MKLILIFSLILFTSFTTYADTAPELEIDVEDEAQTALDFLKVDCKKVKNPTEEAKGNALLMADLLLKQIKTLEAERASQGRKLKSLIVARAGLDTNTVRVVQNSQDGEPLDLEAITDEAYRSVVNKNNKRYLKPNEIKRLAKRYIVEKYLESKNSDRKIDYTHVGILVKNTNNPVGWQFEHLLSPCNTNMSQIHSDGIAVFFLDQPKEYKAMVLVPEDNLQEQIIEVINATKYEDFSDQDQSNDRPWTLNPPTYNVIASINRPEEGNSNSYPLYVLSTAMMGKTYGTYLEANQWAKQLDYYPTKVMLSGFKASVVIHSPKLAKRFSKQVTFRKEDHPYADKYGIAEIVSALSIKEFMYRKNVLDSEFEVKLPKNALQEALLRSIRNGSGQKVSDLQR